MASYYYIISSLPSLRSDADMPITYEKFLDMCKSSVSASTYRSLCNFDLSDGSSSGFVKTYCSWYARLQEILLSMRKEKMGINSDLSYDRDSELEAIANAAINAKNPLEAEVILLKAQFDYLDSLVSMHYFDDYVLFGYAAKLKLLERKSVFKNEDGKLEFKRLFDGIQKEIMDI